MEVLCRGEKDDGGGEKRKKMGSFPTRRDVIRETDRNLNPSVGDPWNFIPPVVVHKQKFKGNRKGNRNRRNCQEAVFEMVREKQSAAGKNEE